MSKPESYGNKVLTHQLTPMFLWRHYKLTAEQARYWAAELLELANEAERTWHYEEMARESKGTL